MSHPIFSKKPDFVLAQGSHQGFDWLISKSQIGYRCGYIHLPPEHPWANRQYDDVPAEAYGGLTFSGTDTESGWWIGFDCAHLGDAHDPALVEPGGYQMSAYPGDIIRTQEFVETECRSLCEQACAVQTEL